MGAGGEGGGLRHAGLYASHLLVGEIINSIIEFLVTKQTERNFGADYNIILCFPLQQRTHFKFSCQQILYLSLFHSAYFAEKL